MKRKADEAATAEITVIFTVMLSIDSVAGGR